VRLVPLLLVAAATLGAAGSALGTVWLGAAASKPTLRVDRAGNAQVTFTSGGRADTVTVPASGQLVHGGSIGADVSRKASTPRLPFAVVVRRTPDGRLWALQAMQVKPGGPIDLHLARWTGAPTVLTLTVGDGALEGRATYHGKGVSGTSYTLEGKRPKVYVYLDYRAGGTWKRMLGVAPKPDGRFTISLRPAWQAATSYRATLPGPNIGSTFAPDAEAIAPAP
jgi:hypothetical protein